jgi:hypothetical protein
MHILSQTKKTCFKLLVQFHEKLKKKFVVYVKLKR